MSDNDIPEIQFEITKIKLKPRVRRLPKGIKFYSGSEVKDSKNKKILKKFNDIKKGTVITVEDAFGNIRKAKCKISKVENKFFYAKDIKWDIASYTLEFDKDDRHCWVCTGTNHVSKEVLKMMNNELVNIK